MKFNIKTIFAWVRKKLSKHPILIRTLPQIIMFITTFGWHGESPFWQVVCVGCMGIMAVFNISDGKLRKANIQSGEQVVEILHEALTEIADNCNIDIGEVINTDDYTQNTTEENTNQEPNNKELDQPSDSNIK